MPLFDQEASIRSVAVAEPRRYMLFCGAGTSASSGIPTAGQCIWRWKQEIYLSKNPHLNPSLFVDPSLPSVKVGFSIGLMLKANSRSETPMASMRSMLDTHIRIRPTASGISKDYGCNSHTEQTL